MGNIVWLASYPKSGNTWIRAFLLNLITEAEEPVDINKMAALTYGDSQIQWYKDIPNKKEITYESTKLAELRPFAHRRIAEQTNNSVFVKTHNALVNVAGVPMITRSLTAGVIYVVRNPLDVLVSYADHLGESLDNIIALMGTKGFETPLSQSHVPEHHSDWSTHVESWTNTPHAVLHVVRFEDMLTRPIPTFGGIAKFLGVNVGQKQLKQAIEFASFKTLQKQEKNSGFIERTPAQQSFFRSGKSGNWEKQLKKYQVRQIINMHKKQMERFDYIPKEY